MNGSLALRVCVAVVALILASVLSAAAGGGDLLWSSEGDSAGLGRIGFVTEDSNRLLAVGYAGTAVWWLPGRPQPLVRLHDATTGALLWSHHDVSTSVGFATHAVLKGARAYVVGSAQRPGFDYGEFVVRAHDGSTGAIVWEDRHNPSTSTPGASGVGQAVVFSGGRLFAIWFYSNPTQCCDGTMLRAYDAATGRLLWQKNQPGELFGYSDQHSLIAVTGHVLVALHGHTSDGSAALTVRAYNAATGATVWADQHSAHGYGDARAAIANAAGRVFVAGIEGAGDVGTNFIVRAYEGASGRFLWQNTREAPDVLHEAVSVVTSGSSVFAAANAFGESFFTVLRAMDVYSGALIWESAEVRDAQITDLAVIGDRLVSVGYSSDPPGIDFEMRAYDTRTGALVWQDHYDVGGDSFANTVTAAGGRVFAAGSGTTAAGDPDVLIRAYSLK